jgi:hypothetical protein
VSSWTNCEPNLIAGSCAIYRLQDEIKAEGELEFADHHYRPLISPQCYQIAAADLAFHREAQGFEVPLDRFIKARLGSSLVRHGLPMAELDERHVSCGAGAKAAANPHVLLLIGSLTLAVIAALALGMGLDWIP